jgi:8-oxo-dGTP pyrophosphatase MutT (NUDIX family)
MNSPYPFQQRLVQLLEDVAKDRLILDLTYRDEKSTLPALDNIRSIDLTTPKRRGRSVLPVVPTESIGMVLMRNVWPHVVEHGIIAQVNAKVDSETPLVVLEEVADAFRSYQGLATHLQRSASDHGRALVFSEDIEKHLRQSGFTPQTIEPYHVDHRYNRREWMLNDRGEPGSPELVSKLPAFVLDAIGIRKTKTTIMCRHSWSLSVSFKSDAARYPVNAVASVLLMRRMGRDACLLLQKRHREKHLWEHWELPQGHILPGESFEEAAVRELAEETQLSATLHPDQPFIKHWKREATYSAASVYTRINQTPKKEFFAVPVLFDYVSGEPRSPEDRQFTWMPVPKLEDLLEKQQIFPLNEDMVRRFVELHTLVGK